MKELKNEYVDQLFDKGLSAVYVRFHKYTPHNDFLKILENSYEIIRGYEADKCLINLKQLPVHDMETAEYINKVWFPKVKELGVRFVAFVLPDSALGKLSSKNAHKNAQVINGLVINNFTDEEGALKWLGNTDVRNFVLNNMKLPKQNSNI